MDIDMLVLHCSAYPTEKLIQIFKELGVSAHYVIDTDGSITQLVDESKRAWHAGAGSWRGQGDINSRSIGIELINASLGHTIHYSSKQIDALITLSTKIIKKYHIQPHNVIAHSDLAPTRKYDPGRLFPWAKLAESGIGLYPKKESERISETNISKLLSLIGYPIENEKASVRAFMRHFMPEIIPEQENPNMNQYDFLLEYEKNLPKILKSQSVPQNEFLFRLQQVAYLFGNSGQK